MIPKVIHYCWFGGSPLTALARKCIASWEKYLPGYEIKEWNESNFDVGVIPYTRDAYEARKYAFVSDYARFWVLYRYGGVYFDTDVEVLKPIDDIIAKGPFMGFELLKPDGTLAVAPGLGLAAEGGMPLYEEILQQYEVMSFLTPDGHHNPFTMIPMVTGILQRHGLKGDGGIESVAGCSIYPPEWFNPFDDATGRLIITANTRSIHWYAKSWMPGQAPALVLAKRMARRLIRVLHKGR